MNLSRITPALFLFTAVTGFAAGSDELTRVTPVPATETIPIVDFVRRPLLRSPRLNRAGTHVAALIAAKDDKSQLLVQNLATQKFEYLIAPDEMEVTEFAWLDDKRLLFTVQGNRMFVGIVGDFEHAYRVLEYCDPLLVSVPEQNRLRPLVWVRSDPYDHGRSGGVIAVKSDFADSRPVGFDSPGVGGITYRELNQLHVAVTYPQPPDGLEVGYLDDKMGALGFGLNAKDGILALHQWTGEAWKKSPVDPEERRPVGAGNAPGQLVVVTRNPPGTPSALQFMDAATGTLGDVLVQDEGYDFNGWLFRDPASHDVVGAVYDRAAPHVVWFAEAYRKLQKTVDAAFPDMVVRLIDADAAARKFIVRVYSDRSPDAYYVLDVEKGGIGLIKNSKPWVDPKRSRPTSLVKFKTRDGHRLDAYVTLPEGASKTNPVPMVVIVSGGLWQRTSLQYDGVAQFLASRGYAVLQANHRWSDGYAWMFPREDEWAFDKMSQDINDATKAVLKSGVIDRSRIAIHAWSFGANLALSAVAEEPELYRAAAVFHGVYDIIQFINEQRYYKHFAGEFGVLIRKLGDPRRDKAKLSAMSAARNADRIRVPVLIVEHREASGEAAAQARGLLSALKSSQTETYWRSGLWYGRDWLNDQIEMYSRLETFLAKKMPAGGAPTAQPARP